MVFDLLGYNLKHLHHLLPKSYDVLSIFFFRKEKYLTYNSEPWGVMLKSKMYKLIYLHLSFKYDLWMNRLGGRESRDVSQE